MTRNEADKLVEAILREYPDIIGTLARKVLEESAKYVVDIIDVVNSMDSGVVRFDIRVHQKKVTDVVISKSDRIVYK